MCAFQDYLVKTLSILHKVINLSTDDISWIRSFSFFGDSLVLCLAPPDPRVVHAPHLRCSAFAAPRENCAFNPFAKTHPSGFKRALQGVLNSRCPGMEDVELVLVNTDWWYLYVTYVSEERIKSQLTGGSDTAPGILVRGSSICEMKRKKGSNMTKKNYCEYTSTISSSWSMAFANAKKQDPPSICGSRSIHTYIHEE